MKITNIKLHKNKVAVYFKSNKLDISENTYTEFNLYINKDISENELKAIKDFDSYNKDLAYTLKLINKYAYTEKKLIMKLKSKGMSEANINKIIKYLNEHKLLNDLEYAKDYASKMLMHHKGPYLIKYRLKELGIKDNDINEVINTLDEATLNKGLINYINALDKNYTKKGVDNKKELIIHTCLKAGYQKEYINKVIAIVK